jgi:DNA-binding LacI/PurR family transcriptional regulator
MRSRQSIEKELRRRIQDGTYAAGSRMPSHRTIQQELGASSVTLQKAFDRLTELGYVEPRGGRGTFVAKALPHVSRIALVFPEEPGKGPWNRFWSTAKRVSEMASRDHARFQSYHIGNQEADSPGHRQLCRDFEDGGLAGVVFMHAPYYIPESPLLTADIPRVVICGRGWRDVERYRASTIEFDHGDLLEDILRRFAADGRRRLAGLTSQGLSFGERCQPFLRPLRLETRAEWWIGLPVSPRTATCALDVARLLFSGPARQRPDCLIISDDNLVPHAAAGILAAGLDVPRELGIAAHANFPGPIPAPVPCLRYGIDLEQILASAAAEVGRIAAGGAPQPMRITGGIRDHLA